MPHTGFDAWNVAPALDDTRKTEGLPESVLAALRPHQLRQRSLVISVQALPEEYLRRRNGFAAHVFRLARTRTWDDAGRVLAPLLERLDGPGLLGLRNAVAWWLRHIHLPVLGITEPMPQQRTLEELVTMTQVVFEEWKDVCRMEGRAEERLSIARRLLRAGATAELVAVATGLSPERVAELAAEPAGT